MKTYKFKVKSFQPLTDTQWANIKDLIEKTYTTGRPVKANLRNVVDGLRHLVRTGCQWRNTDIKYEKTSVLRYYFDLWRKNNTWSEILKRLILLRRVQLSCEAEPDLGAIDSQSVKVVPLINETKGIDGNKKINGRKRHIVVDSEGLLLAVYVGAANENDGKEGVKLLPELQVNYENVKKITSDGAYRKTFEIEAKSCGIEVEITQKPESQQGFVPQKDRWQVERSFAWLNFYRRLSKDYEKKAQNSEIMIKLAFISMILNHF
jgi:putative transposase